MTVEDLEQHVSKILSTKLEHNGVGFIFKLENDAYLSFDSFDKRFISVASFTVIGESDYEYIINALYKSHELLIDEVCYYELQNVHIIFISPIDRYFNINPII